MSIIIPYFGVAVIVGLLSLQVKPVSETDIGPYSKQRDEYFRVLLLIFAVVFVFAGFRTITATAIDEGAYRRRLDFYRRIPFIDAIRSDTAPILATLLWVSNKFFATSQGGIIVTAFVQVLLCLLVLKRDCKDFSFALVLCFANGYVYGTFNGIAQSLAAAVFLFGYKYVCEKKFWKYLIVVIIATMIHNAAILLLPLFFIIDKPVFSKRVFFFDICIAVLMILAYRNLTAISNSLGILEEYRGLETSGHHGVNILTILISIAPAVIAYSISNSIPEEDKITNAVANMVVLDAVIMMVSAIDVYIARFSLFTAPFSIIFLSRCSLYLEERNNILKPLILILYAIVFIVRYSSGVYYNFVF